MATNRDESISKLSFTMRRMIQTSTLLSFFPLLPLSSPDLNTSTTFGVSGLTNYKDTGVKPRKQEMHEVSIAQLIVFLRCIIVTSHHNSHNSLPAVPSSSKSHKPTGSRFFADFSASKRQKADQSGYQLWKLPIDSLFVKENISNNRTENEWIRQKRKKN